MYIYSNIDEKKEEKLLTLLLGDTFFVFSDAVWCVRMSHMSSGQQQLRRVDHENAAGSSICLRRRAARSQLFNLETTPKHED